MTIKDGGSAFPSEFYETEHGDRVEAFAGTRGMTLRDWFAGQAIYTLSQKTHGYDPGWMAKACYEVADAMIAERSK